MNREDRFIRCPLFNHICEPNKCNLEEHDKQVRAEVISGIIALCDDYRASGHNLDVEKYLREQLKGTEE